MTDYLAIADYIKSEVTRQHSEDFEEFQNAYNFACSIQRQNVHPVGFAKFVQKIAELVDPGSNGYWSNVDDTYVNLRISHVGFMFGGNAAPVDEVIPRFKRWCSFASDETATLLDMDTDIVGSLIKTLLDIHPWIDGNGRTASILRNWMLDTLDNPTPLPYFYGDN